MNIIAERNESIDDILNTTEFPCEKRRAIRIDWHAEAMKALRLWIDLKGFGMTGAFLINAEMEERIYRMKL